MLVHLIYNSNVVKPIKFGIIKLRVHQTLVGTPLVIFQVKYYWFHFKKPKCISKLSYYKSNIVEFLLFFYAYCDIVMW